MDMDEGPRRTENILARLAAQDLDPLSMNELDARVVALEAEIARTRAKKHGALSHRTSADALFKP